MIADTNLVNAARTVRERLDRPGWPGAAIGIVRGTDIVLRETFGLASVELDVPPETEARAKDRGVIQIRRANVFALTE